MSTPAAARPAAAAAVSSSSAAAAAASGVTVEDEPTTLKRCSSCAKDQPECHFSGVQLKKKGKRVCSECVVENVAQQKAATTAAALAAKTSPHTPATASSTSAAAAAAPTCTEPTAPLSCIGCGKQSGKLRPCSKCGGCICGSLCHSNKLCKAVSTLPPLSLAPSDLLTAADVAFHWPRLFARVRSIAAAAEASGLLLRMLDAWTDLVPSALSLIVSLYPPRVSDPWWLDPKHPAHQPLQQYVIGQLYKAVSNFNIVSQNTELARSVSSADLAGDMLPLRTIKHTPAVLDESRLIHRLMKYWIYYFRHMEPKCVQLPYEMREYVDVRSDEYGESPAAATAAAPMLHAA